MEFLSSPKKQAQTLGAFPIGERNLLFSETYLRTDRSTSSFRKSMYREPNFYSLVAGRHSLLTHIILLLPSSEKVAKSVEFLLVA